MSMLSLIKEIDCLWEPVYPFLAKHIEEVFGRREGNVLEIGPFWGVIFELLKAGVGDRFFTATFPRGTARFFREKEAAEETGRGVAVLESDPSLGCLRENSMDLAVFRGALFFPGLFRVDWNAVQRVLAPGGVAFVGGGFGKYTPSAVIRPIADRSRDLNFMIGKVETDPERVQHEIDESGARGSIEIVSEGGLWVIMRKEGTLSPYGRQSDKGYPRLRFHPHS